MSPKARLKALRAAPPDGWVAFSSDEERLVAYGKTYEEAVTKAEKNGEPDPVLTKVPKDWSMRALSILKFPCKVFPTKEASGPSAASLAS
jgi:hypothetical protein